MGSGGANASRANVGDALDASRAFGHYGSSSYIDRSGRSVLRLSMDNRHRKKNFTPSDDALIRQQPMSGVGLQILETMLRTNREALMRRAVQLGVSLDISDDHDRAVDTSAPLQRRTCRPATRTAAAGTRRSEVNCAAIDTRTNDGGFQSAVAWRMNCAHARRLAPLLVSPNSSVCRPIQSWCRRRRNTQILVFDNRDIRLQSG